MITAPGLEVAPVVSVSLQCGGGLGCGNEGLRFLDQLLDAWHLRGQRACTRRHGLPFGREAHVGHIPGDRNRRVGMVRSMRRGQATRLERSGKMGSGGKADADRSRACTRQA